jgi:phosphoribosylcarboxyaminoimidazole (NCAIR) mutase
MLGVVWLDWIVALVLTFGVGVDDLLSLLGLGRGVEIATVDQMLRSAGRPAGAVIAAAVLVVDYRRRIAQLLTAYLTLPTVRVVPLESVKCVIVPSPQ